MPAASDGLLDIVIVGGGIVGVAAATLLAEAGRGVTVVDRTGIAEETSAGNAAALAFSEILPLAHKGMLKEIPRWLADPLGPLAIPPGYLPQLLPWLWRFWRAGSPRHFEASVAAQAALMQLAEREWLALIDRAGLRAMLNEDGSLELYESDAELRAALPGWALRDRYGIAYRHVEGDALAELQPGLSDALHGRHLRAGLEDGERSQGFRQGRLAPRRGAGRHLPPRRRRPPAARRRRRRRPAEARRHAARPPRGGRRRRLVASAGPPARRRHPAGDRARLQHDAARRRLRRAAPADLLAPRLRRHAAVDRLAGRRRRRAGRAQPAAQLRPRQRHARQGRPLPARLERRGRARNGWATARRCPTRCR